jgi:transcriptional regulator with GAF, ATPase, and Fis domain
MKSLTGENLAYLETYHYPGNVRELENIIERAIILSSCHILNLDFSAIFDSILLPEHRGKIAEVIHQKPPRPKILTYPALKNLERENLTLALQATNYSWAS